MATCRTCGGTIEIPDSWAVGAAVRRHYWNEHPDRMLQTGADRVAEEWLPSARRGTGSACPHPAPDVYDTCMARKRTNIEIDETSVRRIMDRYGLRTKTEAVDMALRHLAGQPMTREEALSMRGAQAIAELPPDQPPAGAE